MANGMAAAAESTAMTRFAMLVMVGGSLTWLTVTVKERETTLLLAPPSLTVTVIVAEP